MTTTVNPEIEAMRQELALLREQVANGNGGPDDSITVGLREMERGTFDPTVRSIMDNPCAHVFPDGAVCGLSWKQNNDTIRQIHREYSPGSHSYRPTPLVLPDGPPPGNGYALQKIDLARFGLDQPEPQSAVDTYVSEKQAAGMLTVNVKQLRAMVKARTLEADKIGEVTLIRKQSVERVIALAAIAADEDNPEDAS